MDEMYFRTVLDQVRQEVNSSLEILPMIKNSVVLFSKQRPDKIFSEQDLEAEMQEDIDVLKDFKNKLAVRVGRNNITISIGELEAMEAAAFNMVEKWENRERLSKAEEVLLSEALQEAEKAFLEAEETLQEAQKAWSDAETAWHAAAFELAASRVIESDDEGLSIRQEIEKNGS